MKVLSSFVVGGLLAGVLGLSAGCAGSGNVRHAGSRPAEIKPRPHGRGRLDVIPSVVVVSKAVPTAAPAKFRKRARLTSETVNFSLPAWPQGATGTITLTVKCYEADISSSGGEYVVSSEANPLSVFPGSTDTQTVSFTSTQLTDSVTIDLGSESGHFFFIGMAESVNQGGNTYTFRGGTILTKP